MDEKKYPKRPPQERPLPSAFGIIDNDLAAENLENELDMTAADRQDL